MSAATKCDKLNASQLEPCMAALRKGLQLPSDQPIPFSAITGSGRKEVLNYLQAICSD